MCLATQDSNRFTALGAPRRIWAVSSIHADVDRLICLHDGILARINPGDRIVYLGNYTGYGDKARETVDEILTFRRLVLSIPGMKPEDIVYLRGGQEDMWQRLIQLQFSTNPVDLFLWMLGNGMGATLQDYDISAHDGIIAAREGTMSLTKWTNGVRATLRRHAGHDMFMTQYRRAAYTHIDGRYPILFVNAGVDRTRPLDDQGEALWWSGGDFNRMTESYNPFDKVIRGFDPNHEGVRINCVTASLDGGSGFGGSLVCAGMEARGDIFELMEA